MIDGYHVALFRAIKTPFSFDFLWKLLNLRLYARVNGIDKVAALFDPPPPDFHPVRGRGVTENLDGIMRPLMRMLGIVEMEGVTQPDCEAPFDNMSTWVEAFRHRGWVPPKLATSRRVPDQAGCVTITLRETIYQVDRNSDVAEWLKVADWIAGLGHRVVIVRDTAKADEPIEGYETHPEAARDLETRVALYQSARMNLFTANGPAGIATSTNDVPYLMLMPPATMSMFESQHHGFHVAHIGDFKPKGYGETDQWTAWLGVPKGQQVIWADTSRQRIEWAKADTYENIRGAMEQMAF